MVSQAVDQEDKMTKKKLMINTEEENIPNGSKVFTQMAEVLYHKEQYRQGEMGEKRKLGGRRVKCYCGVYEDSSKSCEESRQEIDHCARSTLNAVAAARRSITMISRAAIATYSMLTVAFAISVFNTLFKVRGPAAANFVVTPGAFLYGRL